MPHYNLTIITSQASDPKLMHELKETVQKHYKNRSWLHNHPPSREKKCGNFYRDDYQFIVNSCC